MRIHCCEPQIILKAKNPSRSYKTKGVFHVSARKRMEALQKRMGSAMHVDLVHGIKTFKKEVSAQSLYNAWAAGDYEAIMQEIPWQNLGDHLENATDKFLESAIAGAKFSLSNLPGEIGKPEFRLDDSNPYLTKYIRTENAKLVKYIEEDSRNTIRNAVETSFKKAMTPKRVGQIIKGSVGLLPQHQVAVERYHDNLLAKGVNPERAQNQADAYSDRLLNYRLNMIGRTETAKSLNEGQLMVWQEGARQGLLDKKTFKKIWIAAGENPCPDCLEADGQVVGLDDSFVVGGEVIQCPPAHPQCYCVVNSEFEAAE